MTYIHIDECIVTRYGPNYFFFTENNEFVFFVSEENFLRLFLKSETGYVLDRMPSDLLEDVYRHMANPLGL